jgi:two-component system phosphate regulon sensor histidine kinase PhoR
LLAHSEPDGEPAGTSNDRVVGLVVHELRTPVAIIKAYAELLEAQVFMKHSTLAGSREVMGHILEQADLMTDWVDAMLEVQRLQLGELRLDLTRLDLVQLAWTVAEEFQQTTRQHQLVVVATRPPPPILADRSRVRQVLSNLLENAVKYSAGGTIQVRLGVQDATGRAIVAVHDQGRGLETGEIDHIFAAYEQSERRSVGLGLGLYVARQIAQIHGGDVWAESRGRMNGSTFILALPLAGVSHP